MPLDLDHHVIALGDICAAHEAFRPPQRMRVSQGAAQNLYFKQPGGVPGSWDAAETPYMVEPMDMLASRRHEAVVFAGPARTGKCLDVETPIPTPSGWTTMGALLPGDVVFGADGRPCTVLGISEVKVGRPCFAVEFSDRSTLVADDEHLWGVERFYWKAPNWRYEVLSTSQLAEDLYYSPRESGKKRFRYRVRNTQPLMCRERVLPIDPYLLGVWLGNGSSGAATLSSHVDDIPHYEDAIRRAGHTAQSRPDGQNTMYTNIDARSTDPELFFGSFKERLVQYGLVNNKHIPSDYLRASKEQRLALLQGLMDTDGYPGDEKHTSVEFSTVNDMLKDDFCELARSLGLKPIAKLKESTWVHLGVRKFGRAWRITFPVPEGMRVFTLPRKARNHTNASIDVQFRQITAIHPVPSRPVKCIKVDSEGSLFLAGKGMIPTHNTGGLLLGWMAHNVKNDPGDMLFIQMTQDKAREFSKTDVDRAIRHSKALREMLGASRQTDNIHDKSFRHGMWLRIAWPTVSNVSGSTYRYVAITDLDRMENANNVDGEGPLFDLARKRTQTYLSRGMCLVESSPGIGIEDPNWRPATAHEGPPVTGIIGIYNTSDRRRWYWKCPCCAEWFEPAPGIDLFGLPTEDTLLEIVREADLEALANEHNRIICPHCKGQIGPRAKRDLNLGGRWLADGLVLTRKDELVGRAHESTIAGYWMGGIPAAYQSWRSIILRYLQGLRNYALTGSEESLKTTINTDQGLPYCSRILVNASRDSADPASQKNTTLAQYIVPDDARFVAAAVDVQGGVNSRFIVQVHAVGPHLEQWPIDRFEIKLSKRDGMGTEFAPIDPARYVEDWDAITERVIRATYRTTTEGVEMRVKMVAIDSGGEDGVTDKAYAWYRKIRREGHATRVMLVKGASSKNAPMVKETLVGARNSKEKGDIPLYLLNPNLLKDAVMTGWKRQVAGPGYIHKPGWLKPAFYDEMMAEVRLPDGTWSQVRARNEALDLSAYIRAICLRLGADKIKWEAAPVWARPIPDNSERITKDERRDLQANEAVPQSTSEPAAPQRQVRQRRVSRSGYLG